MSRRKGEYTLAKIRRECPYAVVVPWDATKLARMKGAYPSIAPRSGGLRFNDRDFLVWYFADAADADRFRSASHGWIFEKVVRDDRPATVWPPRNPHATACETD